MHQLLTKTLLSVVVALPFCAAAQHAHPFQPVRHAHRTFTRPVSTMTSSAAKTTAGTDTRLIALSDYKYNGTAYTVADSSTATYTGTHGQYLDDDNQWAFLMDTVRGYSYDGTAWSDQDIYSQKLDVNSNVISSMDVGWDGTAWVNNYKDTFTFNTMNKRLSDSSLMWDVPTSMWQGSYVETYTYNAANKVATTTDRYWDGTTWMNGVRYNNIYGTSGNLDSQVVQQWNTGTSMWDTAAVGLYFYDGSGNKTRDLELFWNTTSSTWDSSSNTLYSTFVNHQPATIIYQYPNSSNILENDSKENYTFTADGKPSYVYDQTWDAATGTWTLTSSNMATHFYYQTYSIPTAGVSSMDISDKVSVYPVPATNAITVSMDQKDAKDISFTIMDMIGRTNMSWHIAGKAQYRETIPVNDLPAGNYTLIVDNGNGRAVKKISIVK